MPYIPFSEREKARQKYASGTGLDTPGELAFIIADALDCFVGGQYDFSVLAAALGAVDSARTEFYEQVVKPYEASKRAENGNAFILGAGDPL
jgi:hypothetical protein